MTTKDRLFIFLSGILIILFVLNILENISPVSGPRERAGTAGVAENISGILTKLEGTGIAPQEAKYYKVVE